MKLSQRIDALARLGHAIREISEDEFNDISLRAKSVNNWFTPESIRLAMEGCAYMLEREKLNQWTSSYTLEPEESKKVGVVMAGNIPLAGFHDWLSVLLSGHALRAKLSSQDNVLPLFFTQKLLEIEPEFEKQLAFPEMLKGIDAVIATGSDNTSRYFEYYFRNMPSIIRKNRSSVIVLKGDEKNEELTEMGKDIFTYFGLGCRNISKMYVPEGYTFDRLYENLEIYEKVSQHHKYVNNYDYNKSIYLVNKVPHLDNGFLLIRESEELVSPISVLFYEKYTDEADLHRKLSRNEDKIQCVVSAEPAKQNRVEPGKAQTPEPWDYPDGIDTLDFLSKI
ncbi:MAG: acyl-CoA reductase [Cyclobacteriaceae bacterium]